MQYDPYWKINTIALNNGNDINIVDFIFWAKRTEQIIENISLKQITWYTHMCVCVCVCVC